MNNNVHWRIRGACKCPETVAALQLINIYNLGSTTSSPFFPNGYVGRIGQNGPTG